MKRTILFAAVLTCVTAIKAQTVTDTLRQQQFDEVVMAGVCASKSAPYAISNIEKTELEAFSKSGRESPFLLSRTPGVLAWGKNGLGMGTVATRTHGAAGNRVNITLDGVALDLPEDQTVFRVNMNSCTSLMNSVQIQRGIGTSTSGDDAFDGSVSLAMSTPSMRPSVEVSGPYDSYNTYNAGVKFLTGLPFNHFVFDGAYHEATTDGYVHGISGCSGSYYGGSTWLRSNSRISCRSIGNFEKTG